MLDDQGTVLQVVHCTTPGPPMHVKYSVNNVSGAEQWCGLGGNMSDFWRGVILILQNALSLLSNKFNVYILWKNIKTKTKLTPIPRYDRC